MMKKLMSVLACLMLSAALALSLFGCGGDRPEITGDEYEVNLNPDKNAEITLKVTSYESERELFEDLMAGFNKEYPNVKLEFDPLAGDLYNTMMGYYNGNNMPDIMINQSFDMLALDGSKILLNLDPYIKAEAASGAEDAFDESDYYDYFWKLGQRDFDGVQIMIPRTSDQVVVHVNKDVLKAAGVDMNPETTKVRNGWTWEDFLEVCAQVRAYFDLNGVTRPIMDAYITWEANFNAIFQSFGVEYFTDGEVTMDNQATRDALDLIRDLRVKGYISKTTSSNGANFDGGQGAFMIHSRSIGLTVEELLKKDAFPGVSEEDLQEHYDVVSFPLIGDQPKIGAGVAGYSVASTTENRDYAWQFVKFMLSKEGQNIFADNGITAVPMRKDMADITDETNHWVRGYTQYNLSAYMYGREENYIAASEFMLERPSKSNDLRSSLATMVETYINFDGDEAAVAERLTEAIKTCKSDLEYWAYQS